MWRSCHRWFLVIVGKGRERETFWAEDERKWVSFWGNQRSGRDLWPGMIVGFVTAALIEAGLVVTERGN